MPFGPRPPDHFRIAGSDTDDAEEQPKPEQPLSERDRLLAQAREQYGDFGRRFEGTINGYFGTPDMHFTMEPGGWYVDLEHIRVNADPTFFLERGYTESEALFATFHEAEHFRDMVMDPQAYDRLFARMKTRTDVHAAYPKALQRFYNCLEDVTVNRVVMNRWKAGAQAKDALYPKLFPTNDFRGQPRHRQFMYALLRDAMLTEEPALVDDEVRAALEQFQRRGGKRGALAILTDVDPHGRARRIAGERFATIQSALEPTFEQMFRADLADRQPPPPKPDAGEPGEGEPGEGDPFGDDPFADAIPDPMDLDDVHDQAKAINKRISDKRKDDFKERMGVDQKDFAAYRRDYDRVKPYIEDNSKVWDAIIERRKSVRRVLRKPSDEGPVLNPPRLASGYVEAQRGQEPKQMFRDFEERETIRNQPDEIEVTLVCDGSFSMKGQKAETQRLLAVLITEALADFRDRIARERRRGEHVQLAVRSEVRMFSDADEELKPLSEELEHPQRVKMHKRLRNIPAGGNNEPATFAVLERQFTNERVTKLAKGNLKKIIVFLTDGESDSTAIQARITRLYDRAGTAGRDRLVIAGIGFAEGKTAKQTYAPHGYYAETLQQLPSIFEAFIVEVLSDV